MKKLCGLLAVLLASGSAWAGAQETDLINLARSGVGEDVLSAYIEKANGPYHFTTDQIIELKNLGVSSTVIAEAIKHETPESGSAPAKEEENAVPPTPGPQSNVDTPAAEPKADVEGAQTAPPVETPQAEQGAPPPEENAAESQSAGVAQEPDVVAPASSDQNISFFYQALTPYGTWISVDGEWCWRPYAAGINPAWSPYYTNGYWTYTDWGWTWVSNYSWGWAPFHYGRWFRHAGYGWMWEPGVEWGPAWVCWRTCDGFFGWAPLPPRARFVEGQGIFFNGRLAVGGIEFGLTFGDYFFVPAGHFLDRDVWRYGVPFGERRAIFARSAAIRDNFRFDHERIFNAGPPRDLVARITHRNIVTSTLVEDHLKAGDRLHGGKERERSLVVYKPMISRAAPLNPVIIRQRMQRTPHGQPMIRRDRRSNGNEGDSHASDAQDGRQGNRGDRDNSNYQDNNNQPSGDNHGGGQGDYNQHEHNEYHR